MAIRVYGFTLLLKRHYAETLIELEVFIYSVKNTFLDCFALTGQLEEQKIRVKEPCFEFRAEAPGLVR